jgi:hypothetical protein
MIDPRYPAASVFLVLAATGFGLVYALPIFLAPLWWARLFRWEVPAETDLTVYFGRCLGGVALAVVCLCYRAAPRVGESAWLFDLIALIGALMTVVHVWGAVKKTQPLVESVEIPLYAALAIVALVLRPA